MKFLFTNLKSLKTHGWDAELTCGKCGASGKPRYEGRSPSLNAGIGPGVTIYAKLACPQCGRRLTEEARRKLVDLFRDAAIPEQNRKVLRNFIAGLILVPFTLAFVLFFGSQMGWWGWGLGTVWVLLISAVSIPLLVMHKNNRIARLPFQCDCGDPHYVFMGLLDDTQCYRCFSCGRLLRVRE
jgi:hypothetical protein